jgi:hypothetical protein
MLKWGQTGAVPLPVRESVQLLECRRVGAGDPLGSGQDRSAAGDFSSFILKASQLAAVTVLSPLTADRLIRDSSLPVTSGLISRGIALFGNLLTHLLHQVVKLRPGGAELLQFSQWVLLTRLLIVFDLLELDKLSENVSKLVIVEGGEVCTKGREKLCLCLLKSLS